MRINMKLQMYLLFFSSLSLQAMQRPTDQEFMTMIEMNFSWRGTPQSHEEIFALVQNNLPNVDGRMPLHYAIGSFKERVEQVIADYEASLYLLK